MAALALLENGDPLEIDGVVIRTPGLNGKVEVHEPSPAGTRGGMRAAEDAQPALLGALRSMRTTEMITIEITETEEVGVANVDTRSDRHGDAAIEVTVPAPGDDFGQFILAIDENGVMSWHVPVLQDNAVDRTRGGGSRSYLIRRHVDAHVESNEARGLIGAVGKKLFKVLVFPIIDPILGTVGEFFVRRWEKRNRPYGLRTFTPANYHSPIGEAIDHDVWKTLSAGKALLFVHGTFSRSYSAFGGLDFDTMDALFERYARRVFAFEHPTLAEDPMENVQWFFDHVPPTAKLDLDIICHSRGGLVSRQIVRAHYPNIAVDRIVFVAAPNAGTILTDAPYLGDFVDSYTNILNAFPDNTVTDTLEAIIAVVKQLAVATLDNLQGLQSMLPSGAYLRELTAAIPSNPKYFAITSDFEPGQDTPRALAMADKVLDKVFGKQKNDLVVPTEGVHKFGSGSLIPDASVRLFASPDSTPVHTRFFEEAQTRRALLEWLSVYQPETVGYGVSPPRRP
jgi:hypothetical protein